MDFQYIPSFGRVLRRFYHHQPFPWERIREGFPDPIRKSLEQSNISFRWKWELSQLQLRLWFNNWSQTYNWLLMISDDFTRLKQSAIWNSWWCVFNAQPPFKSMSSCQLWPSQEGDANTICGGDWSSPLLLQLNWTAAMKMQFADFFFSSRLQALRRGKAIKSETGSEMNMRAIKACWEGYYHHGSLTAPPPRHLLLSCWWQRP